VSFQHSFWVTNQVMPASARIWGRPAGNPNPSGSHASRHSWPNRLRYQRWPWTIWRTSDSPEGTLQSGSTHMPPTGWNWPVATRSRMRANSVGYRSSTHARCCAAEQTKPYSK
jgi:hypothetical protein